MLELSAGGGVKGISPALPIVTSGTIIALLVFIAIEQIISPLPPPLYFCLGLFEH